MKDTLTRRKYIEIPLQAGKDKYVLGNFQDLQRCKLWKIEFPFAPAATLSYSGATIASQATFEKGYLQIQDHNSTNIIDTEPAHRYQPNLQLKEPITFQGNEVDFNKSSILFPNAQLISDNGDAGNVIVMVVEYNLIGDPVRG